MITRRRSIVVVIIVIVVVTTTTTVMRIREEGRGVMGMVVGMLLMVIVRVMTTADGAAEAECRDLPTEFVDGHLIRRRRPHPPNRRPAVLVMGVGGDWG